MIAQSLFAASALFLCSANAHMFMNQPVPIPGTGVKPPLLESGADFPCHGVAIPASGGQPMSAGSSQTLSFELANGANTAVHGGGSCQVSITYETEPERLGDPANWKVLNSIIGGCPSNTQGNLDFGLGATSCTDPNDRDCVHSFQYHLPEGLPNGHATLAMTWFNTIGNREMYMNCAAVQITDGADDDGALSSLPEMFVANLVGLTTCKTNEREHVQFPNPGTAVETRALIGDPLEWPIRAPSGNCGPAGPAPTAPATAAPAPSSSTSSSTTSTRNGGSPPIYTPPTITTPPSNPGGVFAPGANQGEPAPTTLSTAIVPGSDNEAADPVNNAPAPTAPAASNPSAPTPAGDCRPGDQPCPAGAAHGALACLPDGQWGQCNWGCVRPMGLASGTECRDGTVGAIQARAPRIPPQARGLVARRRV